MQPTIEIKSLAVRAVNRVGKAPMYFQTAYFNRGDGVVLPCDLMLRGADAHPQGVYHLAVDSYIPGKYGDVQLRINLGEPVATKRAA